jgi:adenylate cyclase
VAALAVVFISYARDDQAVARRVANGLQAAGFDVWWDADLPAHRTYSEVIERNLEEAKAVVVLWSAAAAKSQWVRAEADFARNAGKLVQAQIDESLPPMPFNQIQCADLKGWRGGASHPGWAKLQGSVAALASGEERPATAPIEARPWERFRAYRWWIAAALALVIAAGVIWFTLGLAGEERKPVLAVLPFTSLDARDETLVSGIWEDTRTAIGRNPQLIVLGPNTAQQLAKKGEGAVRKAADYVLQASVRTAGDRVRVSTALVRTKDGSQLWSQDFDRKLDDVFALQSQIASEIEGRIRGRLAEKGGVKPEQIATSGEAYALYSDARAKFRKRDISLYPAAIEQLEQVTRMDPNFAPAWATLSEVSSMTLPSQRNYRTFEGAEAYARKAIELAPNLAEGHAALAFALGLKGPVARAEIERAVALDPNDYQSLMWLGIMRSDAGAMKGALDAYSRAVEIEPLFWPAVLNKLEALRELHDEAGVRQLLEDEKRIGAGYFAASIEMQQAVDQGDIVRAANIGIETWKHGGPDARTLIGMGLSDVLGQLGYFDLVASLGPLPDFAADLRRNDPMGLDKVEAHHMTPQTFFANTPLPENAGRVYILSGRSAKLADMYLSLNMSPQQFAKLTGEPENFLYIAPLVTIALNQNGHRREATDLIAAAEAAAKSNLRGGKAESSALLARVYAVEGRKEDALSLLATAVSRKWLPQPPIMLIDLETDPAFATVKSDPRFERSRRQILDTIARMRTQVRVADLN